jgi:hypothetical protein
MTTFSKAIVSLIATLTGRGTAHPVLRRVAMMPALLLPLGLSCATPDPCRHQELYVACMKQVQANPPNNEEGWAMANQTCYARADRESALSVSLLSWRGCRG